MDLGNIKVATFGAGPKPRRLANWIAAFSDYSSVLPSPPIFRKWAAISAIASVLERKVWVWTKGSALYANLYVVLVGPPGTGKSAILSPVKKMIEGVPDIHTAPSSVTSASLVDSLADAKRHLIRPADPKHPILDFHHLNVISTEMQNFLPEYDAKFMGMLTDVYDGESYSYRLRTGKVHEKIKDPLFNFLAGTTPSYINKFLPDGAWDQGFTSRTIFVFYGAKIKTDIFSSISLSAENESLHADLQADLRSIAALVGKVDWSDEAAAAISAWYNGGEKPVPEHPKLTHYNSRRLAHLLKLSMIASLARSDEMRIMPDDYATALGWLLEAEAFIPEIFMSVGVTGEAQAVDDLYHTILHLHRRSGKPVQEYKIYEFLRNRVPSYAIKGIIETMERSLMIRREYVNNVPHFVPLDKP